MPSLRCWIERLGRISRGDRIIRTSGSRRNAPCSVVQDSVAVAHCSMADGFFGEEADVVDAAVALGVVHAVADDELVGDFEGYVVGFDGDEAALGFVEAGGDF